MAGSRVDGIVPIPRFDPPTLRTRSIERSNAAGRLDLARSTAGTPCDQRRREKRDTAIVLNTRKMPAHHTRLSTTQ